MENNNSPGISYGNILAKNITKAFPDVTATYGYGQIVVNKKGIEPDLLSWLYSMLESLPEIDAPLERIQFIVKEDGSTNLIKVINPSEFDVTALDKAVERGVNFSGEAPSGWNVPMPLNHPWYSDKNFFRNNSKKNEAVTFNNIKDLPNVKPILEQMAKDGLL